VFGLLSVALAVVGCGLGRSRGLQPDTGDRFMVGSLALALAAFPSGLNRADMWHIATPMLGLLLAFMLPLPRRVFTVPASLHRAAAVLIAAMTLTYLAGLGPPVQYVATGWIRGARDVVTARPRPAAGTSRAPTIEVERSEPDADLLALGAYLAAPERRERPVVPYSVLWFIDKRAGFRKVTYPSDDFLLSDAMGDEVREYLEMHPEALVIAREDQFERLSGDSPGELGHVRRLFDPTPMKSILAWLATIEYRESEAEHVQKERRWARTVGWYLAARYSVQERFGELLVLARR
jgi:hypothetical protein